MRSGESSSRDPAGAHAVFDHLHYPGYGEAINDNDAVVSDLVLILAAWEWIFEVPMVPPPVPALLQRKIVDQPADARELPEEGLLFGGRTELEAVAPDDHPATLEVGRGSRNLWSASHSAISHRGAPLTDAAEHVRNQEEDAVPPRPAGRGLRAQKGR